MEDNFMAKQNSPAPLSTNQKQFLNQVGNLAKPSKRSIANTLDATTDEAARKLARKQKLKELGGAALNLAGSVLPSVLSMVPVAGPLLAKVASAVTGNDDEWFSEFTAAGATFNELLADTKLSEEEHMRLVTPGMMSIQVDVLEDAPNASATYESQYLPILLAYIRKKTNNVLVTTESDYWTAFVTASKLYAIYYTLQKYVDLTADLPTNIPALTGAIPCINPINYSAMVGIVDSLANYLKITIKLPYAWTEYLRWRFGTMFLSENTGKAGLISYDYKYLTQSGLLVFDANCTPALIAAMIDSFKGQLAATSRAAADINLAYEDHQIRYNVEKRHYDAKEFNLRCNLNSDSTRGIPSEGWKPLGTLVYLDSRLDQNAAVQAVTLSTAGDGNWAPFHIMGMAVAWYVSKAYNVPYYDEAPGAWLTAVESAGWRVRNVTYDLVDQISLINVKTGQGAYTAGLTQYMGYISDKSQTASTKAAAALAVYEDMIAAMCVNSLQVHNQDFENIVGTASAGAARLSLKSKLLSYDAAIITPTQIDSIHRIALRNLFRGTYKVKTPTQDNPKIVEPIKDMVNITEEAMVNELPNKIG
jgi:hypothetical protein